MRVTVKNYKRVEWMSEETDCYEASLYLDGKRVGDSRNDGHGGADFIHIDPEHREAWKAATAEWVESVKDNPRFSYTHDGETHFYADEETMIAEACAIYRRNSEMKARRRSGQKKGYTAVLRIERPAGWTTEIIEILCADANIFAEIIADEGKEGDEIYTLAADDKAPRQMEAPIAA